ncbi:MAG: hypothetical protein GXP48_08660 [Acidobacteria bacterium]|nr:hypothetical protein [Acidobacteriota bacterium]
MPVEKFRTLEEAERALQSRPGTDGLAERVRAVWRRAGRFAGRRYPAGVRKYVTLEEAEEDRQRWSQTGAEPPTVQEETRG